MKHPRIIQLSLQVANQIAAGEVVERPASVVKELLENAIDAGATKVDIDIEGGGLHLIRIRDNGIGIVKEDLALAFSPHATSKIQTQADLEAISTMGFRGEALASIASVSRCRLASKTKDEQTAWQIQFTDNVAHVNPCAHPEGTTVEVADLFYNTPVRRKFLRSEKTEFQAIEEVVKRIALAFPKIAINLKHQHKLIRHYPKDIQEVSVGRLAKVCGNQFVENAAFFSMQAGNLALQGWLGFPSLSRRFADCQYFFVNNRIIKDRLINHVIKTVYSEHPQNELGTYPGYVLYLTLDSSEVDVNVHPTKQEVRFSQARMVHDFLTKCVRDTLFQIKQSDEILEIVEPKSIPQQSYVKQSSYPFYNTQETHNNHNNTPKVTIANRYAFLEEAKGVLIIDLSKAKQSLSAFYFTHLKGSIPVKTLLFPMRAKVKIPDSKSALIKQRLQEVGFELIVENEQACLIKQPAVLAEHLCAQELICLIEAACKENLLPSLSRLSLSFFDEDLLRAFAKTNPQGSMARFSHDEIAQFFEQTTCSPS
ncbi:MAG: DNA mismatch repair endonuclease MutL [Proteobacteria bacterium]|nr:DNA mismatch repair endonuclease MutL [Pseudomonadota bacterium]